MENVQIEKIKTEINKVVVGKDEIIEKVMAAIFAGGHILLEDVPGVGKTTLAVAFSRTLSLDYRRIQFTPDVLPSDVVGFSMFNKKTNEFEFKEGAAMCNLLLADEINRTSPKTQAALLEVMEEKKVTVDGTTHFLPNPFIVIATENPVGYVGTQKLPESQLDRFMVRLSMGYPDKESEMDIYKGHSYDALDTVEHVISAQDIIAIRDEIEKITVKEEIYEYVVNLVRNSRENEYVEMGISPRGGIALIKMARAMAYMHNRNYVVPEDVLDCVDAVATHRIILNSKARATGYSQKDFIETLKTSVKMP